MSYNWLALEKGLLVASNALMSKLLMEAQYYLVNIHAVHYSAYSACHCSTALSSKREQCHVDSRRRKPNTDLLFLCQQKLTYMQRPFPAKRNARNARVAKCLRTLAGREYVSICKNRALCDNFLKLCMLLGMDITFSKTTAHKLGETAGGRYAKKIQDGRHWKLKTQYLGSYWPYSLV